MERGHTQDYEVRASRALRDRWSNGKRYYEYDGRSLATVPQSDPARPSRAALSWHAERVFKG